MTAGSAFHLHLAFPFIGEQSPAVSEAYWLKGHGPKAIASPNVSDGYVQTHRIDVDSTGPRLAVEGMAESWSRSETITTNLHDVLLGPPPDFANFLGVIDASWAITTDRHVYGASSHGGFKTAHLLRVLDGELEPTAAELCEVLAASASRIGPIRRVVVSVREPRFRWFGPRPIDMVVHAWVDGLAPLAAVHDEIDHAISGIDAIERWVSMQAVEIVLVEPDHD